MTNNIDRRLRGKWGIFHHDDYPPFYAKDAIEAPFDTATAARKAIEKRYEESEDVVWRELDG